MLRVLRVSPAPARATNENVNSAQTAEDQLGGLCLLERSLVPEDETVLWRGTRIPFFWVQIHVKDQLPNPDTTPTLSYHGTSAHAPEASVWRLRQDGILALPRVPISLQIKQKAS